MVRELVNLIEIDFRDFKFSRVNRAKGFSFDELYMSEKQYEALASFLAGARPEIDKIFAYHSEPDKSDMEMMDVKRNQVGYRHVKVSITLHGKTHLPRDWSYSFCFGTKDKSGSSGMAFGDTRYTREQARNLNI